MTKAPFGFERASDSPGFLFWQTTLQWQRLIKTMLEPHGVSHAQFVILATLLWFEGQKQQMGQAEIVNWTKLDKMTVSKSLKSLSVENLVSRAESETDTRAKTVVLTSKGRKLAAKLVPLVEKIDSNYFGKLSASEQLQLIEILKKIT